MSSVRIVLLCSYIKIRQILCLFFELIKILISTSNYKSIPISVSKNYPSNIINKASMFVQHLFLSFGKKGNFREAPQLGWHPLPSTLQPLIQGHLLQPSLWPHLLILWALSASHVCHGTIIAAMHLIPSNRTCGDSDSFLISKFIRKPCIPRDKV